MTLHPQVRLERGPISFDVDEMIAPLVSELWLRGYRTTGSCQELPGIVPPMAYIAFEKRADAEAFVQWSSGTMVELTAEERARAAQEDDPFLVGDAVAVGFPAADLPDLLAAVETLPEM